VAKGYQTPPKNRKPIEYDIDDRTIVWVPQKVAAMLDLDDSSDASAGRQAVDWFAGGLTDDDNEWLMARLRDPEDDFDIDDLGAIIKEFVGKVSKRPTGSRRG
jgi:hypothetical protein